MRQSSVANTRMGSAWASPRPRAGKPIRGSRRLAVSERAGIRPVLAGALERGAALALLVLAAPFLGALLLFVFVMDGRPVLYRGERLGLRKRPFLMYKVRTLRAEATRLTADRLLEAKDGLEIRGGRFLRDSRLDELPQLWNIVRGEMSFVGPRPERERVYRRHCQTIPGYARRFAVRPGMLGPSQLFTPHATHKRIRAWLDNTWSRRERALGELVGLSAYTAYVAARKALGRALESLRDDLLRARVLRQYREQRRMRRVRPEGAVALLVPEGGPETRALLVDMNEEAMLLRSPRALRAGASVRLKVAIEIARGLSGPRIRHANCAAFVRELRRVGGEYELVLEYKPESDRSHYVLHQYFLRNALACPRARVPRHDASFAVLLAMAPSRAELRPTPRREPGEVAARGAGSRR